MNEIVEEFDPVNKPKHYINNGLETIEVIKAWLGEDGCKAFCIGNSIKYLSRAGKKIDEKEDIQKAVWYLNYVLNNFMKDEKKVEDYFTFLKESIFHVGFYPVTCCSDCNWVSFYNFDCPVCKTDSAKTSIICGGGHIDEDDLPIIFSCQVCNCKFKLISNIEFCTYRIKMEN